MALVTCGSVTPYRLSRSRTSRSLNPTRPFSIRLILERDDRMCHPAVSGVIPAASRNRLSWLPSIIRATADPTLASWSGSPPPGSEPHLASTLP